MQKQSAYFEFLPSEEEFLRVLMKISKNKSPGKEDLTKEFYETFWEELETPLVSSFKSALDKDQLSRSQEKVTKLIQKRDKDKRFIQNWRPISLTNVDLKFFTIAQAKRLKVSPFSCLFESNCVCVRKIYQ